jgi:hypothetical protein
VRPAAQTAFGQESSFAAESFGENLTLLGIDWMENLKGKSAGTKRVLALYLFHLYSCFANIQRSTESTI